MKQSVKITLIGLIFVVSVAAGYVTSARCAYCPDLPCYGTCATPDCVCVTEPGETEGSCYGFSQSSRFKELGWIVGN
jgi:hypothetical protein